jgi:putative transposase
LMLQRRIALSSGDVNLKEWATSQGVSYATARSRHRAGLLPVPARKVGGLVLVGDPAAAPAAPRRAAGHAVRAVAALRAAPG